MAITDETIATIAGHLLVATEDWSLSGIRHVVDIARAVAAEVERGAAPAPTSAAPAPEDPPWR